MPCAAGRRGGRVAPPAKVAPAPPLPAEAPAAAVAPSVNVTVAPATGLPEASRTADAQPVGVARSDRRRARCSARPG